MLLIGMLIVVVGALFLQFVIPVGLIVIGAAFSELRSTSKNANLLSPRVLVLTGVLAAASVTIAILLGTVPELQTDWEHHGPNDQFIMILIIVNTILGLWLAAATGYVGYSLWLKFRFGDERPEVDGN
jgi:small-conductance mechanosensitive channel